MTMARDPKYDILFEPVRIGPKTMRNRFYQTPHCVGFGAERPGTEAYLRAMKAEGGWAVVNTEATFISPEDDFSGATTQSRLSDDLQIRNLALMAERAHEHGALAGAELLCLGNDSTGFGTRLPARAPSAIVSDVAWMGAVYEMDKQELREVQEFYVSAAKRARRAGFDIVNIAAAEGGSLPLHFLMKRYNQRTDEYGGSFENRARFWIELLELVREAVGDDCAVTTRLCIDTLHGTEEGIRVEEEGIGFIQLADHLVDFWDVQVGGEDLEHWVKDAGTSRFYPENFQGAWVKKIRPYTDKPIVGVGRYTNPDTMVEMIQSRQLDIIGAARPSIADPFLPSKIESGRVDEIRECIGCNVCVSRVNAGWHIVCTQNATLAEEYRRGWHPERFDKAANADNDVLVVGAGPAGMECAIVLAKRGMRRVHLVDAADEVGGHFRWVPRLPGLGEWARVVNWRRIQLQKLKNVEVMTKTRLDADGIREYGADLVVMATGSRWATDGLNGQSQGTIPGADASQPWILTPEQIMEEGKPVPGRKVVVYDCETYFVGVSLAEKLAREGHEVTLVTPLPGPAMYMGYTGEAIEMMPLLRELGIAVVPGHLATEIAPGVVRGRPRKGGDPVEWACDAVVLTTQRVADDALLKQLKADPEALDREGIKGLYRCGDCWAPRQQVADAIFDAHRLAREIDSPDPARALPYVREERLLGMTDADYDAILDVRGPAFARSTLLDSDPLAAEPA
jgi:dimethylamine/trimethylamine dehydrogenase